MMVVVHILKNYTMGSNYEIIEIILKKSELNTL
jgi:hypothetical protein